MEKLQSLISIRIEARAAVAEELRLELFKLPTKVAERLEAYEARLAVHVAQLISLEAATAAAAVASVEANTPAASKQEEQEGDAHSQTDLTDDVDDGADLF
jgi:hypothetical protein